MQKGSTEHMLARAEYYSGLLTKTTDPVSWPPQRLTEAAHALRPALELGHRRYVNALAAAESALLKSI